MIIFVVGCKSGVSTIVPDIKEPVIPFIDITPEIEHRVRPNGFLTIEGDAVTYKSHRAD